MPGVSAGVGPSEDEWLRGPRSSTVLYAAIRLSTRGEAGARTLDRGESVVCQHCDGLTVSGRRALPAHRRDRWT